MHALIALSPPLLVLLAGCGDRPRADDNATMVDIGEPTRRRSRSGICSPTDRARPRRRGRRTKLMHDRHEGMEDDRRRHASAPARAQDATTPDLARCPPARCNHRRASRRKCRRLVPAGHRPGRRQDRRQGRNLAEARRISPPRITAFQTGRAGIQRRRQGRRRGRDQGARTATSARAARPATTLIAPKRRHDEAEPAAVKQPVWDLPTRLFHWTLVALIGFSWWTAEEHQLDLHIWSGIAVLTLLIFRLLWGMFGSSTARFAQFRPRAARGARLICAASGRDRPLAARRAQRHCACSVCSRSRSASGLFSSDEDGLIADRSPSSSASICRRSSPTCTRTCSTSCWC